MRDLSDDDEYLEDGEDLNNDMTLVKYQKEVKKEALVSRNLN